MPVMSCIGLAVVLSMLQSYADIYAAAQDILERPDSVQVHTDHNTSLDNGKALEKLEHLLSPEMQHSLAGVLNRYGGGKQLADPEVDAFMGTMLHDELEAQQTKLLADEESAAQDAAAFAKMEEEKSHAEHERQVHQLEASRKADLAEREERREHREGERKRTEQEGRARQQAAHAEMLRKSDELAEKTRARREKSEKRRADMDAMHAKNWEKASSLLKMVHNELEVATDGWRDAPFWDDFFRTSSAATRFAQLGFSHIEPALRASGVMPEHEVLVLEPRGANLANRLAEEIRAASIRSAVANAYGSEGAEGKDLVIEVGILDAMAMGGAGAEASKLDALKSASARLAKLVRPGGTWISVSAVPPALRVPLLGRLAGGSFVLPSEKEDAAAGTHALIIPPAASSGKNKSRSGLRGSAQVADMLLYGSEDVHVWAYRMRRAENPVAENADAATASSDGLLDIIRQQRPATRDDL